MSIFKTPGRATIESELRAVIDDLVPEVWQQGLRVRRSGEKLQLEGRVDARHATLLNIAVHRFVRGHSDWTVSWSGIEIVVPQVRLGDVASDKERQILRMHTGNDEYLNPDTIIDMPEWNPDFVQASDRRHRSHIRPRYGQDGDATIQAVAAFIAEYCQDGSGIVVHTGAGISAAAGIATYREGSNKSIAISAAMPTYSHFAIVGLVRAGFVDYVCSQNVDGLHRRSGLAKDKLSELHGNSYIETCSCCSPRMEFVRPYDAYSTESEHPKFWARYVTAENGRTVIEANTKLTDNELKSGIHHITGRACPNNGGPLRDSVIHFGESLPVQALQEGRQRSQKASMNLVIGSSLLVQPACSLPFEGKGPVAIVSMSCTGLDLKALKRGGVLLRAPADAVVEQVVRHLGMSNLLHTQDLMETLHQRVRARDHAVLRSDGDVPYDGGDDGGVVPDSLVMKASVPASPELRTPSLQLRQTHECSGKDRHLWSLALESADKNVASTALVHKVHFHLHPTFEPCTYTVTKPPFAVGPFLGWGTFQVKVVVDMGSNLPPISTRFPLSFDHPEKILPFELAAA